MPTKLSRFCLGVMEAAWLAAVCLIPIFFNIWSARIFEPDKITILRSLALLTLGAWIVKIVDEGGIKWKSEDTDQSFFRYLLNYPLVAPIIGLIIVYSISTIFSVTPSISFFGSYQRLEGTYTTFSYLIIFFSIITNLRKREQIKRLITTVIFTSFPISFYGILQHWKIDPIPWGGDVSIRIAANLGNSIFVAAYMIMVFPLTVGRIIESFKQIISNDENAGSNVTNVVKQTIRGTIYIVIAGLQLVAIYWSGSRGPLLGLLAGSYLMILLLSLYWRKRWLTFATVILAILGAVFLVVFNQSNGPLEALRKSPAIGRFGNLLNSESNSALVRQYIWEGTVKLVGIHDPLKFPDGSTDKFNFLRPLIGYGPESMYVAYNQFYQPELGQVEKRNASPDRAHNETWDSLVITGISGLLIYLTIFGAVFYYGLKWLGLINTARAKLFFFICLIGGGFSGSIVLITLKGIEYLGVGLPFGMVIGLVAYLSIYAIFTPVSEDVISYKNPYALLIIVLFSAIVGHFVEINFGIAIVSTRTLFWVYSGIILVIGFVLPKINPIAPSASLVEATAEVKYAPAGKRKERSTLKNTRKNGQSRRPYIDDRPEWVRNALIGSVIIGLIMATLGYDYITNPNHSLNFVSILYDSLFTLSKNDAFSPWIFILISLTLLVGILLYAAELEGSQEITSWLKTLGLMAGIAIFIGVLYWFIHSIRMAFLQSITPTNIDEVITQVDRIGSLLTIYYFYILIILGLLAFILPIEWPSRSISPSYLGAISAVTGLILVVLLINTFNLRVIHADITFKMAEPWASAGQWDVVTRLYQHAEELTPREDHYYLFLGRSYLEQAKLTQTTSEQDSLVNQAGNDLKVAQSINPLNTDHTANLARLYTWWAGKATSADQRSQRAQKASDYYATAVQLSPNNSNLWDEWAVLSMQLLGQPNQALQKLQHALGLDAKFNFTQGLLGDYYVKVAGSSADLNAKQQALEIAAGYYQTAAEVSKYTDVNSKASYLVSLSNVYVQMANLNPDNTNTGQLRQAIGVLEESVKAGLSANDLWKVQEALARMYLQLGDKANAQFYASQALTGAPASVSSRIQDLITQTQSLP
jgi:tetratricopeptide (TPR) repeat protein/O-antigen ligase